MVYFLNDVDDGGEVVLPLANSKFEVFRLTPLSCVCLFMSGTEFKRQPQATKAISFFKETVALLARKCNI